MQSDYFTNRLNKKEAPLLDKTPIQVFNPKGTILWKKAIPIARHKGYFVREDGTLIKETKVKRVAIKDYGYGPHFTLRINGHVRTISTGRFAAYCHFGEEALNENRIVKYKDGRCTNLAKDNIELGTRGEGKEVKGVVFNREKPGGLDEIQ